MPVGGNQKQHLQGRGTIKRGDAWRAAFSQRGGQLWPQQPYIAHSLMASLTDLPADAFCTQSFRAGGAGGAQLDPHKPSFAADILVAAGLLVAVGPVTRGLHCCIKAINKMNSHSRACKQPTQLQSSGNSLAVNNKRPSGRCQFASDPDGIAGSSSHTCQIAHSNHYTGILSYDDTLNREVCSEAALGQWMAS